MGSFARILTMLPKNMTVPAVVLAIGWYGGAKYGAPDYLMESIDGLVAEGSAIVGGLISNDGDGSAPQGE